MARRNYWVDQKYGPSQIFGPKLAPTDLKHGHGLVLLPMGVKKEAAYTSKLFNVEQTRH